MDELTLFPVLKTALKAYRWDGDAGNDKLFAPESVIATLKEPEEIVRWGSSRTPFAAIVADRADADPEDPQFGRIDFSIVIGVSTMGNDPMGEIAMLGGHETGGSGSSAGKGILELHENVKAAIRLLDRDDGVTINCRWRTSYGLVEATESNPLAMRQMVFSSEF